MTRDQPTPPTARVPMSQFDPNLQRYGNLGIFKEGIEKNDPFALYQAIMFCSVNRVELPRWLTAQLLDVISNYYLGKKPGKVGGTNTPLAKIRKRLEVEVRRRAVDSVRAWQQDRSLYNAMPTQSIHAWFSGQFDHKSNQSVEKALTIAQIGLKGLRLKADVNPIACSPITLKRTIYPKKSVPFPSIPPEAAMAFGFNNPDAFFGTDQPLPNDLK